MLEKRVNRGLASNTTLFIHCLIVSFVPPYVAPYVAPFVPPFVLPFVLSFVPPYVAPFVTPYVAPFVPPSVAPFVALLTIILITRITRFRFFISLKKVRSNNSSKSIYTKKKWCKNDKKNILFSDRFFYNIYFSYLIFFSFIFVFSSFFSLLSLPLYRDIFKYRIF